MFVIKTFKILSYEMGLHFHDGEFRGLLGTGRHWFVDPLGKVKVEVVSQRNPWLTHEKLDVIVRSGALKDRAVVLDLKDDQRGLVWVEGRFSHILPPGLYAYWTGQRQVKQEGGRGQPHRPARRDRRYAEPGQHGQAAGRQPDAHASA